ALQSRLLSAWASRLSWTMAPGASAAIVVPENGPLDQQRGYSLLPEFRRRLEAAGWRVSAQARLSPWSAALARWGIAAPYRDPALAGLIVRDGRGEPLLDGTAGGSLLTSYGEVPPLIVRSLLHLENRELGEPSDPRANPVIDWGRFATAGIFYARRALGFRSRVAGGSTLATQLEKYRHSPGGRTASGYDKLRQMTAASLRDYSHG